MFGNQKKQSQQQGGQNQRAPVRNRQREEQELQLDFISPDDTWIYESLLQYVNSPVFKSPILQFIDENCMGFLDTRNLDEQHEKVFREYQNNVDNLIGIFGQDIGITLEKLKELIQAGLAQQEHARYFRIHALYFNQNDFNKYMVKRNLDLERQAMGQMGGGNVPVQGGDRQENYQGDEVDPEAELELAIQESLHAEEQQKKKAVDPEQEMKDLQAALALSKLESEERERKIQAREEDELERAIRMSQMQADIEDERRRKDQSQGLHQIEEQKFNHQQANLGRSEIGRGGTQKEFDDQVFSGRQNLLDRLDQMPPQEPQFAMQQQQQQGEQPVESLEEKKARLLKQRQLLLEKKRQQREQEVKEYTSKQGLPENPDQGEQANAQISESELEKRRAQYEKIRQNMQ